MSDVNATEENKAKITEYQMSIATDRDANTLRGHMAGATASHKTIVNQSIGGGAVSPQGG